MPVTVSNPQLDADTDASTVVLADIAAIRAATFLLAAAPDTIRVLNNYVAGDGGGMFRLDSADTTSADDGGMIINTSTPSTNLRYKRQIDSDEIYLAWYGVGKSSTGRTGAQNSAGIAAGIAYAVANDMSDVLLPPSTYTNPVLISKTIDLTACHNIRLMGASIGSSGFQKSTIRWNGHTGGVMLRSQKEPRIVKAISTANVNISTLANTSVVDGVTLATGDYVLLKNQTTASENGPYLIGAAGPATRATYYTAGRADDFNFYTGTGTANIATWWTCTQDPATVTLGTTALTFSSSAAGTTLQGGGILGVSFDGYLVAANGLSLWGCVEQRNGTVYVQGCTDTGIILGATTTSDYLHCSWERMDINCYNSAAGTQDNGKGLKWTSVQGWGTQDIALCRFGHVRIQMKNGLGFDQGASDTNITDIIMIQRVGGGSGQCWTIRAGDNITGLSGLTSYNYSYDNYWNVTASNPKPTFEAGAKPAVSQHFNGIVFTSGYAAPTFDSVGTGSWFAPKGERVQRFSNGATQYEDGLGNRHFGYTTSRTDGCRVAIYDPLGKIMRFRSDEPGADAKVYQHYINSSGTLSLATMTDAGGFGSELERWERSGTTPVYKRFFGPIQVGTGGVRILDTNSTHGLVLKCGEDLTGDTTVNFVSGTGATRTLQLNDTQFTGTITAAVTGDLSVAYASQQGRYQRHGKLVFIQLKMAFTPTYTTASGEWTINGLPFTIESTGLEPSFAVGRAQAFTRPANATIPQVQGNNNTTTLKVTWPLTTGGLTSCDMANIPSGSQYNLWIGGHYFTADA